MNYSRKSKKALGQNFISSASIAERIVSYAGEIEGYNVIEVGPGLGIMTKIILRNGVNKLVAIEKDIRLSKVHAPLTKEYTGRYECIYQDVLAVNLEGLISLPAKMISNLPYSISVVLLLKLLKYIHNFDKLILMFQKEVADRIVAQPGTKQYSILSVLVQLLCDVTKLEDFPPEVFNPAPKVHSSVIDITPLKTQRFAVDYLYLSQVLKKIFSCKRKTIHNSLKPLTQNSDKLLMECGISPSLRAENLSIKQLCTLANALQNETR